MMARFEPIKGGYVYLTVDGVEYRVYYEEAGQGIPLLLLHTAGSEGLQYRFLLNDPDVTDNFRCISFDLPYHGKSLPPYHKEWWKERYLLTLDFLIKFLDAFIDAFELERPAYMGSSMGGHLAADLAYYCPEKYCALIGLEGALATASEHSKHSANDAYFYMFDNPFIGKEALGGSMDMIIAPMTPDNARKEITWCYNKSAPGVFAGDINYYNHDHDLTDKADKIDVNKCMLYLLTGAYDPATKPSDTKLLADKVKGCYFKEMDNLGHFPVTENYDLFKTYLMPVLDDILKREKGKAK
jgi:pimeloyl-ACP methyl ester carboxylesterase